MLTHDALRPNRLSGASARDRETTANARRRLRESTYRDLRAIDCQSICGVLTLRGSVFNFYSKQLAQEAVRRVPGVTTVVNAVEVLEPY